MKIRLTLSIIFLGIFLAFSGPVLSQGDGGAIKKMSMIMMHLNHFPSDKDKEWLRKLAGDSSQSAHIRTIATAMANLQHRAMGEDKAKLMQVIDDGSASADVKDLARIIHDLSHQPSSADRKRLGEMAGM